MGVRRPVRTPAVSARPPARRRTPSESAHPGSRPRTRTGTSDKTGGSPAEPCADETASAFCSRTAGSRPMPSHFWCRTLRVPSLHRVSDMHRTMHIVCNYTPKDCACQGYRGKRKGACLTRRMHHMCQADVRGPARPHSERTCAAQQGKPARTLRQTGRPPHRAGTPVQRRFSAARTNARSSRRLFASERKENSGCHCTAQTKRVSRTQAASIRPSSARAISSRPGARVRIA